MITLVSMHVNKSPVFPYLLLLIFAFFLSFSIKLIIFRTQCKVRTQNLLFKRHQEVQDGISRALNQEPVHSTWGALEDYTAPWNSWPIFCLSYNCFFFFFSFLMQILANFFLERVRHKYFREEAVHGLHGNYSTVQHESSH